MKLDGMRFCFCLFLGFALFASSQPIQAQQVADQAAFVDSIGSRQKYAATIEMKKGYVSGICFMTAEDEGYRASLFNEFGISALEFTYQPSKKHQVKLEQVLPMLDKWYIRRVLKRDMAHVVDNLLQGISTYTNEKYHIKYQFKLLNDATEE